VRVSGGEETEKPGLPENDAGLYFFEGRAKK